MMEVVDITSHWKGNFVMTMETHLEINHYLREACHSNVTQTSLLLKKNGGR